MHRYWIHRKRRIVILMSHGLRIIEGNQQQVGRLKKKTGKKQQHCSQVTNILIWFSDKSVRHKLLEEKKSPEYSRHRNKDLEEVNHILTETRCYRKE